MTSDLATPVPDVHRQRLPRAQVNGEGAHEARGGRGKASGARDGAAAVKKESGRLWRAHGATAR
eukprot:12704901-Alexandrium_andersonii.AAC.1